MSWLKRSPIEREKQNSNLYLVNKLYLHKEIAGEGTGMAMF